RAADVEPAGAARDIATDQTALPVGRQADEHQRARPGACLEANVGDAAHAADRRAPGWQAALIARPAEDVAEPAAAERPAHLGLARERRAAPAGADIIRGPCGRGATGGARRLGAQVRSAHTRDQRVAGRPADRRERDRGRLLGWLLDDVRGAAVPRGCQYGDLVLRGC